MEGLDGWMRCGELDEMKESGWMSGYLTSDGWMSE